MSLDPTASSFVGVRVQGGLLPADLLAKVMSGQVQDGLSSKDFHLAAGETVREAANRVWAYLRGAWTAYRQLLAGQPESDAATALTRDRFLLLLLDQLGYGRVPTTGKGGIQAGERSFPISHLWGNVPIHLLGRVPLDTRTKGMAGAAAASPQSMVQELLNRSDDHLWAILANATTLRLIRDSTSLVGSAYVEFDLDAIFDGDLFADFLLLYSLCHVSRLETRDPELGPASCWLEQWRQGALESGSRALNLLRDGVVDALQTLGSGFLTHPDNARLRDDLAEGTLTVADVNHALLRTVYRLLFTFVAEDRGALLDPDADPKARCRYLDYFSTERLRRTARRRRGGRYGDRWEALKVVWRGLGSVDGLPELGIPGIGGLFDVGALDFLMDCSLSNEALQSAVRSLSLVREPRSQALRVVDYRNLGAEELGSIYESLLELMPSWDAAAKAYALAVSSGNQRRDTGSYYTPTSLVESLLDTALDPVLDDAEKSDQPEQALLAVTVCDPACGSGHFLVGAARRIAKRVAALRTGDPEPAPAAVRSAMRDVIGRCIYGVDLNPLAAELARVSLWMEALEPGWPLTFLDAQIKVGNALVGATPKLLADGLPDEAFKPIEGDDKKIAATLARQNKAERSAQGSLFDVDMVAANTNLAQQVEHVMTTLALSLADVHVQQQRLRAYTDSDAYRQQRLAADAWCAAFVWPKTTGAPAAITQRTVAALNDGEDKLTANQRSEVERLSADYRFFHWHLEFPHIFPTESHGDGAVNPDVGWSGGFSVVIGNPPWEHIELKEREFFESRDPEIAKAAGATRKRLIAKLLADDSPLGREYVAAKRRLDGVRHFAANSERYPLCGRGRVKTDPLFAETGRDLLEAQGRFGLILPTGIATDSTTQFFFKDLVEHGAIASLYDFENRKPLFEAVDSRFKFCLLTLTGRDLREPEADFAFFAHDPTDLERPGVRFTLSPEEITLLNPNSGTCPIFRSRRDAEITLSIYRRIPVLLGEGLPEGNPWGIKLAQGHFNMTSDSRLFHSRDELESEGWVLRGNVFRKDAQVMFPLYEAKMVGRYDHRAADVVKSETAAQRQNQPQYLTDADHENPSRLVFPLAWVNSDEVPENNSGWLTGFADVTSATNERTVIAAALPNAAVGNTLPLFCTKSSSARALVLAVFNSFVFDYVARQKVPGLHLNFVHVMQLPVLANESFSWECPWSPGSAICDWVTARVVRLSCTAIDMYAMAREFGYQDGAFRWEREERFQMMVELDAAFFRLYGIERDDVEYIMETFPIVKRKDLAEFGEYRTMRMILEVYDAMAEAEVTGIPYESGFRTSRHSINGTGDDSSEEDIGD